MSALTLINGNRQPYQVTPPAILILSDTINDTALQHIKENTGLDFIKGGFTYAAQAENHEQISALLLTYNFKTRYYNNATYKNTLMLRFDGHVGFDVTSICYDCAQHNHIHTTIDKTSRLSC